MHPAQTTIAPGWQNPEITQVPSVAGFLRASLVRLSQPGGISVLRVVSDVDAANSALMWLNPEPGRVLPYDRPLSGLDPNQTVAVESLEYTIIVKELGVPVAVHERVALIPEHPRYGPALLAPLAIENRVYAGGSKLPPPPEPIVIVELRNLPVTVSALSALTGPVPLVGGRDGLALLEPYDFIGEDVAPLDSDVVKAQKTRGVRVLDGVEEVSIVAVPDVHIRPAPPVQFSPPVCKPDPCLPSDPSAVFVPPAAGDLPRAFTDDEIFRVQGDVVDHCERLRDRVFIIDPPFSASRNDAAGLGAIRAWRQRFESRYAALYFPWIKVVDPLRGTTGITRDIPPSGHVAGRYADSDFSVGVHKAPANDPLEWSQDTTVPLDEARHGILNSLGINAIRPLTGRGIRIMGARTVSSDPDWRFVNVRRLIIMIERALIAALQWAVFEPNEAMTRAKVRLSIVSFLIALHGRGALAGDTADQAFRVKCDEENNTPENRVNGRLNAHVLVAPSNPFEFVVVRVGRIGNQFEIEECSNLVEVH